MKNSLFVLMALIAFASYSNATGLSFSTTSGNGKIFESDGSPVVDGALFRFGTLSSTVGSSITDFESNFSELGTATFSGGELTALSAPGTLAGSIDLYAIAYAGSTSGNVASAVFFMGTTPSGLGLLVSNPFSSTVLYGSGGSGSDIRLSPVPEPSAFAAISGFLALGWVMLRRRRA